MFSRDPFHTEHYRDAWLRLIVADRATPDFVTFGPIPRSDMGDNGGIDFRQFGPIADIARTILTTRGMSLVQDFDNVSAVALSLRYRDGEIVPDEPCITFFVREKLPDSHVERSIPRVVAGIPTDVIEAGIPELHSSPSGHSQGARLRPVEPGSSLCHVALSSGTLGCLVEDAQGVRFALSCAHVLSDANWRLGDATVQPGPRYGGATPADDIAHLAAWLPLHAGTCAGDAAIARLAPGIATTPTIRYVGARPRGTRVLTGTGVTVQKSGDATGLTHGIVTGIYGTIGPYSVNGINGIYFRDTIVTSAMSLPGDSGSLLVDYQAQALGLLFGGLRFPGAAAPGGFVTTWFNPIDTVLQGLNVRLIP